MFTNTSGLKNVLNKKLTLLFAIVILIASVCLLFQYKQSAWFPIDVVNVSGNFEHTDQALVKNIVTSSAKEGFFAVDIKGIQQHLLVLPWLSSVSVSRIWPNKLLIQLQEKTAIARWNSAGLLLQNGDTFYPNEQTVPSGLPDFSGPSGQQYNIVSTFVKMNEILAPATLNVMKIDLSSKLEWKITLNNNIIVLLGNDDVLLRLTRFIQVYEQEFESEHRYPVLVDMRYNHGAAVKWTQ